MPIILFRGSISKKYEMCFTNWNKKIPNSNIVTLNLSKRYWNLEFVFLEILKPYAFLFDAAVSSNEIAERSILSFPDMVSITAVASVSSEILP